LRFLIVDDHCTFVQAARTLLEREGETVVGVATTTAEALLANSALRPDVALVDVLLGEESGFELARLLATAAHHPAVILVSTRSEADLADRLELLPTVAFLPKSELSAAAVRRVLSALRGT
jgi:DNA-binding NarL/FixJ family response regulator